MWVRFMKFMVKILLLNRYHLKKMPKRTAKKLAEKAGKWEDIDLKEAK